jgi:hypothetical protein
MRSAARIENRNQQDACSRAECDALRRNNPATLEIAVQTARRLRIESLERIVRDR